jgi:hypothetical protein
LTESDIEDAGHFMLTRNICLNERGMVLKEEASAQVKYAQRMRKLTKILPTGSIKVVTPRSIPSPKSFFLIAHELYLKNPTFSKSILTSLMESMVAQMTNPTKSPKIEARAMNFFCYIATVSPQAAEFSRCKSWIHTIKEVDAVTQCKGESSMCV